MHAAAAHPIRPLYIRPSKTHPDPKWNAVWAAYTAMIERHEGPEHPARSAQARYFFHPLYIGHSAESLSPPALDSPP